MSFESLIISYGYLAVFVGTLLEGETVLVVAGFLADRGYLSLPWVIVAGVLGTLLCDQIVFQLGRRFGRRFLDRRPHWAAKARRVRAWADRHQNVLGVGFRFLYGLRTVTPIVLATTTMSTPRFLVLNTIGATLWTAACAGAGYLFGTAVSHFFGETRRIELLAIAVMVAAGLIVWLVRFLVQRHRATKAG